MTKDACACLSVCLSVSLCACVWGVCVRACVYHGLVGVAAPLELQDPVGVCGGDLCVFGHRPALRRQVHHLDQRVGLLFGRSPGEKGHMLAHQLTTAAPDGAEDEDR